MLQNFLVTIAVEEAKKSEHKFRMGAVIFKGKSVVSRGHNYPCKSVKHLHPRYYRWPHSVHSEIDAIIKARTDVRGMSLLVVRLSSKSNLAYSYPCEKCLTYIVHSGIKNIYYVNKMGKIEREKL
jgi:deoxycytidylate deaminase